MTITPAITMSAMTNAFIVHLLDCEWCEGGQCHSRFGVLNDLQANSLQDEKYPLRRT